MTKKLKAFLSIITPLILIAGAFLTWGFLVEPDQLLVNNYDLKLKKWSPPLDGLKIVAISDLHAGAHFITEEKIREIVAQANDQHPDLIVLLGDYVSHNLFDRKHIRMPVPVIAENLRGLQAKYGVFAVLGNVDEAFNKEAMRNALEKAGIRVLSNEVVSLNINGESLRLLGLQDTSSSADWKVITGIFKEILTGGDQNGKIIVLVHNPDYFPVITGGLAASQEISLVLAGHTHGGQIILPLIGAPIVPSARKYAAGHLREQDIDLFVTTGIGTSLLPVRLGVPPEIAVLTLSGER